MRKLATFAFAFSGGIFLAQYLLPPSWLLTGAGAAFVLAWAALFLPKVWRKRLLLVGVGLSLALGYDWLYLRQVQRPLEALADTDRDVVMTLCEYPVPTDYGARVTVRLEGLPGKAVYYGDESLLELVPGQTAGGYVHLQSAGRIRDDDVTTFTSKGVFLLAYARGNAEFGAGSAASPRWWPARMGRAMRDQIGRLFNGDDAGFLTAILTGDKSGISEETGIAMSEAGIYHMLAVSGMHCMFLLSVVRGILGAHRRRLVAFWALPMLAFYALLTGGTPSVVRACVMMAFLLAAPLFHRDSDAPTALAAALLCILLANPFAAASVSLQLSFGAMAGLLWLTPKLNRLLLGDQKRGKAYCFTVSSFSATMGALVFTIPLSAHYFNLLVLVSPLSNLLCLWAASVVFILGLLTVLVSFLWLPVSTVLVLMPRAFIWYIISIAKLLSDLPYHALYFSNPYLKFWMAYAYILFGTAYLLRPRVRRKYAVAALLAAVTLTGTVKLGTLRYASGLHVLTLDVGQGQSVVLAEGGTFALVDCGSGNSWYDAGQIAADQLQSMGCKRLDYLVLTHYDADHVNGVTALLERLPVAAVLVPELRDDELGAHVLSAAESRGAEVRFLRDLEELPLGAARLTVYPPVGKPEDNERGLAVCCTAGEDYDLLITGDMSAATERALLAAYPMPDIEALLVGHHGSKTSTSDELLAALTPETAIISVGPNSYGHPTAEALRRLVRAGADICRTDMQGTIHLTVN